MNPAPALPPEHPGRPADAALMERRRGLAAAAASGMWRTSPPPREQRIGGVRVLWFDPPGQSRGLILHFHGGAFRIGAPEAVGPYAAALARRCGVTIVCPAYRLAPEHPFPAALTDGWSVMQALATAGHPDPIVAGVSAGGNLAASLVARATTHAQTPRGLILLSAWLDLTLGSPCYETNAATDPLFSRAAATEAAELYLQGAPPGAPLASPLLGSLAGFPPTFVNVGLGEVLAHDARRFHDALQAAGIPSQISAIPGMDHVAVTRDMTLPGAAETFDAVCNFIETIV